ncbi:hypothetical protein [Aurantimonas coralicida]|uniref:hypothetical protein n=1 Tax=Aurantimonas coralicida TaxID=182270 RepID=UPI001E56BEC1|nr:hypothetical protein [Aurantimonas coralicida]
MGFGDRYQAGGLIAPNRGACFERRMWLRLLAIQDMLRHLHAVRRTALMFRHGEPLLGQSFAVAVNRNFP